MNSQYMWLLFSIFKADITFLSQRSDQKNNFFSLEWLMASKWVPLRTDWLMLPSSLLPSLPFLLLSCIFYSIFCLANTTMLGVGEDMRTGDFMGLI